MKFIDSFTLKYVKKDKKNFLTNLTKELSNIKENGFDFEIKPNETYGRIRLEIYETSKNGELLFFDGLTFTNLEDFDFSEVRSFSDKIILENSFICDFTISEISDDLVKGLILKDNTLYLLLDKDKTKDYTNNDIATLALKYLIEDLFEAKFNKEDYEIEIETELTDFFM